MSLSIDEAQLFCEFADKTHKHLAAAVVYLVLDNFIEPGGEETQEVVAIAYGYAGGQTQGDFLFRRDSYNSSWLYSDSSGGEWKGARTMGEGSHLYDEECEVHCEWNEQDQEALSLIENIWDEYFCLDSNENVTVKPEVFQKYKQSETVAHSEGFDMDHLWDISPITNFTTQYSDPYYES